MTEFDPENHNPNIRDLYFLLGKMSGKMDGMINAQNKTIYALIALAGATVGLKLMGTPPLQVIMYYAKAFIFLFTAIVSFSKRKELRHWYFLFGFAVFAGVSQFLTIIQSEQILGTALFLIANVSLLLFVWCWDSWYHSKKLK